MAEWFFYGRIAYEPLVSLNKALLNPYFWEGTLGVLVDQP